MQNFARVPMEKLFPSEFDDIVVVGHISMNPKKNKKKLQKIADSNSKQANFRAPQQKKSQNQSQNQYTNQWNNQYDNQWNNQYDNQWNQNQTNNQYYQNQKTQYQNQKPQHKQQQKPKQPVQVAARPMNNQRREVTKVVCASRPPAVQNASVVQWIGLPEEVMVAIFGFSGVAAIAGTAPTCQAMAMRFGLVEHDFWRALAGPSMSSICRVTLKTSPRDAFRRFIFGLEGQWLAPFTSFAETNDAVEVLNECDYLVGGMVAIEKSYASGLVRIVLSAAARCIGLDNSEFDQAADCVATTVRKMERRTEVFSAKAISDVREAGLELQEKGVLARLEENDDAPTFDYFQDDVQDVWAAWDEKEEVETGDSELADSFLDLLTPQ